MRRRNSQSSEYADESKSPRRDRSRQRSPRNEEDDNESDNDRLFTQHNQQSSNSKNPLGSASQIACKLRSIFLQFWGSVKHEKGFVFTKQQREKLIKQQIRIKKKNRNHNVIQWKQQCEWDQDEQKSKIKNLFANEQLKLPQASIALLQEIFFNTSFLFGNETTQQLYKLLIGIVKIHLDEGLVQDKNTMIHQYMEMVMKGNNFKFFNYKFSNLFKLNQSAEANLLIYKRLGEQIAANIFPNIQLQ